MSIDIAPAVDSGTEEGIEWKTCRAPIYGAVNGYVRVPEDHPWHGLDYDDIDVDVHGGLTYARDGWIGFDTLHFGDHWPDMPEVMRDEDWGRNWTPAMVAEATRELARKTAAAPHQAKH